MAERYVFDFGRKKVEIELVKTKLFCRYCTKLNTKCIKKHRSAVAWLIRVSTPNKEAYYIVTDGEIPPEHADEYTLYNIKKYYITRGDWVVPSAITSVSEDIFYKSLEQIDDEPTEYEMSCLIHRLLGKHKQLEAPVSVPKFLMLSILADLKVSPNDITKIELSWLKEIYARWLDDSEVYLTDSIYIKRIPRSFREKIEFPTFDEVVSVECKKYSTLVKRKTEHNKEILLFYLKGAYRIIPLAVYVKYSPFKKALYWLQGIWRGKEKYHEYIHPECTISPHCIYDLLYEIIHQRLGDLLFLDKVPTHIEHCLQPATKDQLNKIILVNANLEEVEENNRTLLKITSENNELPIQIIHPEHGSIELAPCDYNIYRVPYIQPGHD